MKAQIYGWLLLTAFAAGSAISWPICVARQAVAVVYNDRDYLPEASTAITRPFAGAAAVIMLAWLLRRQRGAGAFAGAGAIFGVIFGGIMFGTCKALRTSSQSLSAKLWSLFWNSIGALFGRCP
jgi:hypothetical protein